MSKKNKHRGQSAGAPPNGTAARPPSGPQSPAQASPAPTVTAPIRAEAGGGLLRDQQRALHAYRCVGEVAAANDRKDYKIAVNDLGANILRVGLAGAMAALERLKERGQTLLGHLASAGAPGLVGASAVDLPDRIRRLPTDDYMLATREFLQIATWLKRAVQATFGDDGQEGTDRARRPAIPR